MVDYNFRRVESLIVFAQQKIKLNLNSRWLVIFVLRLAKPPSKSNPRFRSAKVNVTQRAQWSQFVFKYFFWESELLPALRAPELSQDDFICAQKMHLFSTAWHHRDASTRFWRGIQMHRLTYLLTVKKLKSFKISAWHPRLWQDIEPPCCKCCDNVHISHTEGGGLNLTQCSEPGGWVGSGMPGLLHWPINTPSCKKPRNIANDLNKPVA